MTLKLVGPQPYRDRVEIEPAPQPLRAGSYRILTEITPRGTLYRVEQLRYSRFPRFWKLTPVWKLVTYKHTDYAARGCVNHLIALRDARSEVVWVEQ